MGLLNSLERFRGAGARERVLAALPADVAVAFNHGQVLPIGWYPVTWYAALHAAIDAAFGRGPEFARALGQKATLSDFSGLHRMLASMLSVETVFGQTHRLMGLYWKGGTVERKELEPGYARLIFANWAGFTRLVWEDIIGSTEGILSFCKAPNVRSRVLGTLEDVETIEIELRWG